MTGTGDLELGGCEGCSLGCAVTCADGRDDPAERARQTLVAAGVGVLFLAVVPGLVSRSLTVQALAAVAAWCAVVTAGAGGLAVRRGRPDGDRAARVAFRTLPPAVAVMALTWIAAVIAFVAA